MTDGLNPVTDPLADAGQCVDADPLADAGQRADADARAAEALLGLQQPPAAPQTVGGDLLAFMQYMEHQRAQERMEAARQRREEFQMMMEMFSSRLPTAPSTTVTSTSSTATGTTVTPSPAPATSAKRISVDIPKNKLKPEYNYTQYMTWKREWEDFVKLSSLESLPRDQQLAYLRQTLSNDMKDLLRHNLDVPEDTQLPLDDVLKRIEDHMKSQRGFHLRCFQFNQCHQISGESFDTFLVRLRKLASEAELCSSCIDRRIIERIIVGIEDEELRTELLSKKPDATLDEIVTFARSFVTARNTASELKSKSVNATSTYKKNVIKGRTDKMAGKIPDKKADVKPTCEHCKGKGHIQDNCWKKYPEKAPKRVKKKPDKPETTIGSIQINELNDQPDTSGNDLTDPGPCPTVMSKVKFGNNAKMLRFLPDSGSRITTISTGDLKKLKIAPNQLKRYRSSITAANNTPIECIGTFTAEITYSDATIKTKVHVCKNVGTLLSYYDCKRLRILPHDYPSPQRAARDVNSTEVNPHPADLPDESVSSETATLWFKRQFSDVLMSKRDFDNGRRLPRMKGAPMKIEVDPTAKPFKICNPRQLPYAWMEPTKRELETMVKQGIIEKVGDEVAEWCAPMVATAKPDGSIRICTDFTKLNPFVQRPAHPTSTPEAAIGKVKTGSKYFTTMDCLKGYFQVPIVDEHKHYTTFITPFGRYRYRVCPMGLISSSDEFNRRVDTALDGLDVPKVMDDFLLADSDHKEHMRRIYDVLVRCRQHGITLNADKFFCAMPSAKFVGYVLSQEGKTPSEEKVNAIKDFPTPANITDLRSFMGLVNQLGSFSKEIAELSKPLRPLLSTKQPFMWTADHQSAFDKLKEALSQPPVVAFFDVKLPTALHVDASKLYGIGFALMQKHGEQWKLVQCGSRGLSDTESRYAVIELELLAVVWALKKCRYFLLGLPKFDIITDHNPLVPILNEHTLDSVENPRLQRLKEKTSSYLFRVSWKKGKEHAIPDALSRNPVNAPTDDDIILKEDELYTIRQIVVSSVSYICPDGQVDLVMQELVEEAQKDQEYLELHKYVMEYDKKKKPSITDAVRPYHKFIDHLTTDGDLVLYGSRIVVPKALRTKTLKSLHAAHMGIEATKRRARQSVWWPAINNDVTTSVEACEPCQTYKPSLQKEPLMSDTKPEYPFEVTSADIFSVAGNQFLIYADRLSGWSSVYALKKNTTSEAVMRCMRTAFQDLGVPRRLRTDGGPQFASAAFREFLAHWKITHELSSPHYPQSNGHAEAHVKSMKRLIQKVTPNGNLNMDEFAKGLIELRNTPRSDGVSPAQILLGRTLRSGLPVHRKHFSQAWNKAAKRMDRQASDADQAAQRYNRSAKPLPPLKVGDSVRVQDHASKKWTLRGEVAEVKDDNRSYLVRFPSGRILWRNRRFLAKVPSVDP